MTVDFAVFPAAVKVDLTIRTVVTTTDADGNSTTATTERVIPGCLFEPQQATERTDPRSPGVVTPAKFYAPEPVHADADDEVETDGSPLGLADPIVWSVIGGSSVWGNQTEIPVRRVG